MSSVHSSKTHLPLVNAITITPFLPSWILGFHLLSHLYLTFPVYLLFLKFYSNLGTWVYLRKTVRWMYVKNVNTLIWSTLMSPGHSVSSKYYWEGGR